MTKKIVLTHRFLREHYREVCEILSNASSIDAYMDATRKRAQEYPKQKIDELEVWEGANFIGGMFELFCEFLCKRYETYPNLRIRNFQPGVRKTKRDNGLDGEAVDSDTGNPVFFQFKGHAEFVYENGVWKEKYLTAGKDRLDSAFAETHRVLRHRHPLGTSYWPRVIVITSAKGIHWYTKKEKYDDAVECIAIEQLRHKMTNERAFWDEFRASVFGKTVRKY